MTTATSPSPVGERARDDIYRNGITALRGAFSAEWADDMRRDIEAAFAEAIGRPDGAVGRGPNRYYVEIHPEQFRGFVDLVTHPWVTAVCEAVLGRTTRSSNRFEHAVPRRGVPALAPRLPDARGDSRERRLNSLAFNLTGVDTVEEMGPFEIATAPSRRWRHVRAWNVPAEGALFRYEERAVRKYPKRGDISARSR